MPGPALVPVGTAALDAPEMALETPEAPGRPEAPEAETMADDLPAKSSGDPQMGRCLPGRSLGLPGWPEMLEEPKGLPDGIPDGTPAGTPAGTPDGASEGAADGASEGSTSEDDTPDGASDCSGTPTLAVAAAWWTS